MFHLDSLLLVTHDVDPNAIANLLSLLEHVNRSVRRAAVGLEILRGGGHGLARLSVACASADPDKDLRHGVKDKDIAAVEHAHIDVTAGHFGEHERARLVTQAVQEAFTNFGAHHSFNDSVALLSGRDGALAAEKVPERLGVLIPLHAGGLAGARGGEVACYHITLVLLEGIRVLSEPHVDIRASVKDEAVASVQAFTRKRYLRDAHCTVVLAHNEKLGNVSVRLNVAEAALHAAF